MKLSKKGIEHIKSFEGLRLKAYKVVQTEKYYTIGYGHYGADVTKDMRITEADAEELLRKDLEKFEEKVNKYVSKYKFNQNQFDALVSFAYNVGNIDGLTANGTRSIKEIADKMLLYNKSGGTVLKGLVTRRKSEYDLFNGNTQNEYKSEVAIALEVIDGEWFSGEERRKALEKAGYDYNEIQQYVNEILEWLSGGE